MKRERLQMEGFFFFFFHFQSLLLEEAAEREKKRARQDEARPATHQRKEGSRETTHRAAFLTDLLSKETGRTAEEEGEREREQRHPSLSFTLSLTIWLSVFHPFVLSSCLAVPGCDETTSRKSDPLHGEGAYLLQVVLKLSGHSTKRD